MHILYTNTHLYVPKKDADRRNTLQSARPPPARGESSAANHKPWLAIAIANPPPRFIFVSFFVANCVTMIVNNSSAQHNER